MVYSIPKDSNFVSFITFNNLEDLGFDEQNLKLATCSKIAFLTMNNDTKQMFVNILLIDAYEEKIQACLFKSSKGFDTNGEGLKDGVIKAIMYKSIIEIKLLLQQWDHLYKFTL